jgi:hypothetical protein
VHCDARGCTLVQGLRFGVLSAMHRHPSLCRRRASLCRRCAWRVLKHVTTYCLLRVTIASSIHVATVLVVTAPACDARLFIRLPRVISVVAAARGCCSCWRRRNLRGCAFVLCGPYPPTCCSARNICLSTTTRLNRAWITPRLPLTQVGVTLELRVLIAAPHHFGVGPLLLQ